MSPTSSPRIRPQAWIIAVALLTVATFAFNFAMAMRTPIWFDEAHTYWVIREGFWAIMDKLALDVHPPLYFCLTYWGTLLAGTDPAGLRLVSVLAATLTIPAVYWMARSFVSQPWAFGAAVFVATHPLFTFYAYEARSYGLFLLGLIAATGAIFRVASAGARWPQWTLLTGLFVLLIFTHNLTIFVFPPLVLAAGVLAGERWRGVALRVAAIEAFAFLIHLPWFFSALRTEGGFLWVSDYWKGGMKYLGPIYSLYGFGSGAEYADYMLSLHKLKGLPILSAVMTAMLLFAAGRGSSRRTIMALWFGAGTMVLIWAYSWVSHPIYLLGRYDLVSFPFVALLLCLGARGWGEWLARPAVGGALLLLCVMGNVGELAQLWKNTPVGVPTPGEQAISHLVSYGGGTGDLVVTRGHIAFMLVRYTADRTGVPLEFQTYPAAVASHPGWYSADIFMRDPGKLKADADRIVDEVRQALAAGRHVWLLDSGDPGVDKILLDELVKVAVPDEANSSRPMRLFAFRAI